MSLLSIIYFTFYFLMCLTYFLESISKFMQMLLCGLLGVWYSFIQHCKFNRMFLFKYFYSKIVGIALSKIFDCSKTLGCKPKSYANCQLKLEKEVFSCRVG